MGYGRVWAEIDLGELVRNYKKVKRCCEGAKILFPIKADAYGHGAIEIGRALEHAGVFMFGVAGVEEGIELRIGGIKKPILVLSPIPYEGTDAIFEYDLRPTISDVNFFKLFRSRTHRYDKKVMVHIEIDTGMTRTGLPYNESLEIIKMINQDRNFSIEGIFTHYPVADTNAKFSRQQIVALTKLKKRLGRSGIRPKFLHIANTAGIICGLGGGLNLARPGIALYGLLPSDKVQNKLNLQPVLALKSMVVNVREVAKGTPVSYGHTFRAKRYCKIATLSVGYGDGYPLSLSNKAEVIIRGKRARVIGAVCMDLLMTDVTHIPGVKVNDVATLIGREKGEEITAQELATKAKTIVYEITCGIGPRVPRVYYYNHKFIRIRNLLLRGLL